MNIYSLSLLINGEAHTVNIDLDKNEWTCETADKIHVLKRLPDHNGWPVHKGHFFSIKPEYEKQIKEAEGD